MDPIQDPSCPTPPLFRPHQQLLRVVYQEITLGLEEGGKLGVGRVAEGCFTFPQAMQEEFQDSFIVTIKLVIRSVLSKDSH